MAIAGSARNLMVGSGNVTTTVGSKELNFQNAQAFKEGATVVVDHAGTPKYFTIDVGAGTKWMQAATAAQTVAFKTTQASNSRARGTDGVFVPNAAHFMYRAVVDHNGNPDWYFYFDTVFPEKGLHPYTKDQYTGSSVPSADTEQALIPDLGTRMRIIEGILRGHATPGTILDPDKRLDQLEARIYALEGWANGAGHFGTPPAQGANALQLTLEQMLQAGDA